MPRILVCSKACLADNAEAAREEKAHKSARTRELFVCAGKGVAAYAVAREGRHAGFDVLSSADCGGSSSIDPRCEFTRIEKRSTLISSRMGEGRRADDQADNSGPASSARK